MSDLLEKAIAFARSIHAGQLDKGGGVYIDHPLRVMEAVRPHGRDAMIAAVLHDTLEDGGITVEDLRAQGFPEDAIQAVAVVTKRPDEEDGAEGYSRFIERIALSGSKVAIRVKLADLADNLDLSRLGREPTAKDQARSAKYARARERLETAVGSPE